MVAHRPNLWPAINYQKLAYGALGGQHLNTALNIIRQNVSRPDGTTYNFHGGDAKAEADLETWIKRGAPALVLSEATTAEEARQDARVDTSRHPASKSAIRPTWFSFNRRSFFRLLFNTRTKNKKSKGNVGLHPIFLNMFEEK